MTLPDLLTEAARLMPERFIWLPAHQVVRLSLAGQHGTGQPCADAFLANPAHLGMIQWAAEAECEARGWDWHTHNTGPEGYRRHCAQVYPSQSALSGMFQAYAPTPAEALLSALIQAVEGERA